MLKMPRSLVLIACAVLVTAGAATAQTPPAVHVLKIAAGPSGAENNGAFVLTEERLKFSRTADREVIVFFHWDGVPGAHKLVAQWRSPDGGFTSNSTIDYKAAERRFGAYWRIAITPTMQLGMWSIEATVDGQPGGRLSFEIIDETAEKGSAPKRPLAQQELFEVLRRSYVVLNRVMPDGRDMEPVGGVVSAGGQILTGVRGLDGAGPITAVLPDGTAQPVTSITALSRPAGWALIPLGSPATDFAKGATDPPKVGDRCYSMQTATAGSRVLIEGQITGLTGATATTPAAWMASFFTGLGTNGSPVVNEYGELLGILAGVPSPTISSLRAMGSASYGNVPVIPLSGIPSGALPNPIAIDTVRAGGHLLTPLEGDVHVLSGGFAGSIGRGPAIRPEDQRDEFSAREKDIVVFVTWAPRDKLKGQTSFHVYDPASRVIMSSKPTKVNFRKSELVLSSVKIPVPRDPGIYRAEIHLDGKAAWRGFVRITP
jgi:S1-C subfamily serine protease